MNIRIVATLIVFGVATAVPCSAQETGKRRVQAKLTEQSIRSERRLYREAPEGKLYLHVYYPAEWKKSDARPAVVFFFGGGWTNGSYLQFEPLAQYFASRGLVAAAADYRIRSQHNTTPVESVEDAKCAIRWVRAHAQELGIDADKIVGSGGSAGGHLAAATALLQDFDAPDDDESVSCKPNALVLFNPVLNLTKLSDRRLAGDEGRDLAKRLSPTLNLDKSVPPAILFYGTGDRFFAQGEEYATQAKALGGRAEVFSAAGAGHGFFNRSPWTEVTARKADEFLGSIGYLKGPPTVKLPDGAPQLEKR
jgi:acetyl esterase/lipase